MKNCSCHMQIDRSASILGIAALHQEKSDRELTLNTITKKIYNSFAENKYVITRPVGDCPSLKALPFVAIKRIPLNYRKLINSRKNWVLDQLQTLGAFPDIIDHVNDYSGDDSPQVHLMISQAIFFATRFDAGRHLVKQLVQFIDLREGGNQLIRSVYDQEFKEKNTTPILKWAAILEYQTNLAENAASRARLLANHLIDLGTSNPAWQSSIRNIIKANCWNIFP